MSDLCHICGPVKHEAPTVICAPCALTELGRKHEGDLLAELIELRIMRTELARLIPSPWISWANPERQTIERRLRSILALAPSARPA